MYPSSVLYLFFFSFVFIPLQFCIFVSLNQLSSCFRFSNSFLCCSNYFFNLLFSSFTKSNSFFNLTVSISTGAPKFFFKKSIELFGLSCYSYKPTNALVRLSITPLFSKYFLNYYFFDSVV